MTGLASSVEIVRHPSFCPRRYSLSNCKQQLFSTVIHGFDFCINYPWFIFPTLCNQRTCPSVNTELLTYNVTGIKWNRIKWNTALMFLNVLIFYPSEVNDGVKGLQEASFIDICRLSGRNYYFYTPNLYHERLVTCLY